MLGRVSTLWRRRQTDAPCSQGEVAFLLATDVAARGLDILGVEAVVNFDAPAGLDGYLHRIGRTARAGEGGRALTFVEDGDRPLLKEVCAETYHPPPSLRVVAHRRCKPWLLL